MRAARPLALALSSSLFLLGACGGPEVAGTYNCPHQSVLHIRDDGSFTTVGHDSAFEGTYEVDGETISFSVEGTEPAVAVIRDDGSIVFVGEHEHRRGAAHEPERCVRR